MARELFTGKTLYGPDLRRRSLAAVEARVEARQRRLAWLLAPGAALVVLLTFALPAWLLSIPLTGLLDSDILGVGLALVIIHVLGLIPAGLCTVFVLRHHVRQTRLEEVFHA
jgi:hypothetical protein